MSIVKDFSTHFKSLRSLLSPLGINEVSLNQKEASSRYDYGSHKMVEHKGIESDHLKIFSLEKNLSFALAFNFKGLQHPVIWASVKEEGEILSAKLTRDQFKTKINQFLKLLTVLKDAGALSKDTAYSTFKANFLKETYDPKKDAVEVLQVLLPKVKDIEENYEIKIKAHKNLKKKLADDKASVEKAMKAKAKELNLAALKKAYDDAQSQVFDLEQSEYVRLQIHETEKAMYRAASELTSMNHEVRQVVEKETKGLPRAVRAVVEKAVDEAQKLDLSLTSLLRKEEEAVKEEPVEPLNLTTFEKKPNE